VITVGTLIDLLLQVGEVCVRKTRAQRQMARRREREDAPIVVPPPEPRRVISFEVIPTERLPYFVPDNDDPEVWLYEQGFRKLKGTDYEHGRYD
jgi:hypothetical protein